MGVGVGGGVWVGVWGGGGVGGWGGGGGCGCVCVCVCVSVCVYNAISSRLSVFLVMNTENNDLKRCGAECSPTIKRGEMSHDGTKTKQNTSSVDCLVRRSISSLPDSSLSESVSWGYSVTWFGRLLSLTTLFGLSVMRSAD